MVHLIKYGTNNYCLELANDQILAGRYTAIKGEDGWLDFSNFKNPLFYEFEMPKEAFSHDTSEKQTIRLLSFVEMNTKNEKGENIKIGFLL